MALISRTGPGRHGHDRRDRRARVGDERLLAVDDPLRSPRRGRPPSGYRRLAAGVGLGESEPPRPGPAEVGATASGLGPEPVDRHGPRPTPASRVIARTGPTGPLLDRHAQRRQVGAAAAVPWTRGTTEEAELPHRQHRRREGGRFPGLGVGRISATAIAHHARASCSSVSSNPTPAHRTGAYRAAMHASAVVGGPRLLDVTDDLAALDGAGSGRSCSPTTGRRCAPASPPCAPHALARAPAGSGRASTAGHLAGPRAFCAGVRAIRASIAAGDVYQVNLCRVLSAPRPDDADVAALGAALAEGNPAPYSAVVRLPGRASRSPRRRPSGSSAATATSSSRADQGHRRHRRTASSRRTGPRT